MDKDTVLSSINTYFLDRISSPFTASFIVSWCGWNYKLLLVLLSTKDVDNKIDSIQALYASYTDLFGTGVGWPLSTAMVALLVFPLPNTLAYMYWRWQQRILVYIKHKFDKSTPLSSQEADILWDRLADSEKARLDLSMKKNAEINLLSNKVTRLIDILREANINVGEYDQITGSYGTNGKEVSDTVTDLTDAETKILKHLGINDGYESEINFLNSKFAPNQIEQELALSTLKDKGYIESYQDAEDGDSYIGLTTRGKQLVVDNKFNESDKGATLQGYGEVWSEPEHEIIRLLSKDLDGIPIDQLQSNLKHLTPLKLRHFLDVLKEKKYIDFVPYTDHRGLVAVLTDKGRAYAVEKKLDE